MDNPAPQIPLAERILWRLEKPPWSSLYRILIGLALWPTYSTLFGGRDSAAHLLCFLLAILALLRLVPAVLRRVLPFSSESQSYWRALRQQAKNDDSYQWQKLFWIGLGLLAHAFIVRFQYRAEITLALISLTAGLFGLICWRTKKAADQRALPA